MKLFSQPGGGRVPMRAALLTIPFDLPVTLLSTGRPERTFAAASRGTVLFARARGQTFAAAPRATVFETAQLH